MPDQEVISIPVSELVLWTENPRDPISHENKNEDIIVRALNNDKDKKWSIRLLSKEMGDFFDYSELPTVVYENDIPIVYDGNRRVIIAMLKLNLYPNIIYNKFKMPNCPNELPCNVTSREMALKSVWRKHAETGSWDSISRAIFLSKFMGEKKSEFLQLNEILDNLIASTADLNQRFVGEEILINSRLKDIGIKVENGQILSRHSTENTQKLLNEVFNAIISKRLSTRKNRNILLSNILSSEMKSIVIHDGGIDYTPINNISMNVFSITTNCNISTQNNNTSMPDDNTSTPDDNTSMPDDNTSIPDDNTSTPDDNTSTPDDNTSTPDDNTSIPDDNTSIPDDNTSTPDDDMNDNDGSDTKKKPIIRLTPRIKSETFPLFGAKLELVPGEPSNLYRDIMSLYNYYEKNKTILSDRFPALIRMALRLECELIAHVSNSKDFSTFVTNEYDKAKNMLSQQEKTFLITNSVNKDNIITLLHTGAHNYESSYNLPQTIAMSLIIAGLLKIHCGKK